MEPQNHIFYLALISFAASLIITSAVDPSSDGKIPANISDYPPFVRDLIIDISDVVNETQLYQIAQGWLDSWIANAQKGRFQCSKPAHCGGHPNTLECPVGSCRCYFGYRRNETGFTGSFDYFCDKIQCSADKDCSNWNNTICNHTASPPECGCDEHHFLWEQTCDMKKSEPTPTGSYWWQYVVIGFVGVVALVGSCKLVAWVVVVLKNRKNAQVGANRADPNTKVVMKSVK